MLLDLVGTRQEVITAQPQDLRAECSQPQRRWRSSKGAGEEEGGEEPGSSGHREYSSPTALRLASQYWDGQEGQQLS